MKIRQRKYRAFYEGKMHYQSGRTPSWLGDILSRPDYYNTTEWTGEIDINKKDIYEGDIIRGDRDIKGYAVGTFGGRVVVEFFKGGFIYKLEDSDWWTPFGTGLCPHEELIVVGNIFEDEHNFKFESE